MVNSSKYFSAQSHDFPLISKIIVIAIVLVWPFYTNPNCCCLDKDMIRCRPMGYIRRISNPGSGGTEYTKFIWCVDVREPQINKLWCLGLDNITHEVHLTAHVQVVSGTMGEFTTDYFVENGCWILIIGQISINGSVPFLVITDFIRGSGLLFIPNCWRIDVD